ncbi:MAG: RimK family alpha-L-glutamate ligase [Flavobacteriales bacterium]|nr:RimK family alpha-L-glutamate ligase [Flavobacteriales bacterium]
MLGWILQRNYLGKQISYETQKMISTAKELGIELSLHDPREFEIVVTREDRKSVLLNNVPTQIPDFIIPRMGATTTYFAFAVIRHFERLGVYCVNPSASIDTVKDKLFQMQILANSGFSIPKTILAKFPVDSHWVEKQIKFPAIVKALSGSQGSGVFLCENQNMLEDLMKVIESANKDANFIIQEFISDSRGRDLRVYVIGGKVVGAMERSSSDESFKANFSRGGTVKPFKITEELEKKVLEITELFNLEIAGIDLLFDGTDFRICEVNSSPGFKGLEKVNDVDVAVEILNYIKQKVKEHQSHK